MLSHGVIWTFSATGIACQSIGMAFVYFRFTTQLITCIRYKVLSVAYFKIGSGLLWGSIWQLIYEGYYKLNSEMYYSVNCIVENSHSAADRQFALWEICFWTATILKSGETNIDIIPNCPICSNDNISLIPLSSDDVYELSLRSKCGLRCDLQKYKNARLIDIVY